MQSDFQISRLADAGDLPLPRYMTEGSAGMDLYANVMADETIEPGRYKRIPTGIRISVPRDFEAQIRPRSGLALKHGVTMLNAPGTIDSDYRGEISVILINFGNEAFTVTRGMRIAQMVIAKVERVEFEEVQDLDKTDRGCGGFGHTG